LPRPRFGSVSKEEIDDDVAIAKDSIFENGYDSVAAIPKFGRCVAGGIRAMPTTLLQSAKFNQLYQLRRL
jgi:hypothetical protein